MVFGIGSSIIAPRKPEDDFGRIVHKRYTKLDEVNRELHKRLDDKIDQEVLVVEQRLDGIGGGCVIGFPYISTEHMLGILTGKPSLEDYSLIIPTKNYVEIRDKVKLHNGMIKLVALFEPFAFDSELVDTADSHIRKEKIDGIGYQRYAFRIFSGNDVADYFRKTKNASEVDYAKALKLLGIDISEDFKSKYDEHIIKKKTRLVEDLEVILDKIPQLRNEFEQTRERMMVEKGYDDGDKWVNYSKQEIESGGGKRKNLEDAMEKARGYIIKAVELGMHEDNSEMIYKRAGMRINQRDYVTNLMKEFKVNVPA